MSAARELIVDAVVSALANITNENGYESDVTTVSTTLPEDWGQPSPGKCPWLLVLDGSEVEIPVSLQAAASDNDWQGEMKLLVACCIWSNDSDFKTARNNLMLDIKKVMLNSTDLTSRIMYVSRIDIQHMDYGMVPKYDHFNLEFTIVYGFDHTVGG